MFLMNIARSGNCVKMLIATCVLGTFAQGARAGQPHCRELESSSGRLACYDAAFPPKTKRSVSQDNDALRGGYKDPLVAEDARTAAKLKNICRGC
jgi:hypothetical protein